MRRVHLDYETFSLVDLTKAGAYVYAAHPSTRVLCAVFLFEGEGELVGHWRGNNVPQAMLDAFRDPNVTIVAHNALFERLITNYVICPAFGIEPLPASRFDCTMLRALHAGLPASLDLLTRVLDTETKKDMVGYSLMRKMSTPRYKPKSPEQLEADTKRLILYCCDDVMSEVEVDAMIGPLSDAERQVWLLDQEINDRGVLLDIHSCEKAKRVVELYAASADAEMCRITEGAVEKVTQTAKLVEWLTSRGVECTSVAKEHIEDLTLLAAIVDDEPAKQAVALRASFGLGSTAKFEAMVRSASADHRSRGAIQYYGAPSTGRFAGRLWQPHNLPRVLDKDVFAVKMMVDLLSGPMTPEEIVEVADMLFDDPLSVLSKALRSMVIAKPGYTLVGADLSNIEGRVLAAIARETWKLAAFRAYDEKRGPDLYKLAFSNSFGVPVNQINDMQRQIGKVQELAFGYQGGVQAFLDFCAVYGISPNEIAAVIERVAPPAELDQIEMTYISATDKCGLDSRLWACIKFVVKRWRAAHQKVMELWWALSDAGVAALTSPGVVIPVHEAAGSVRYLYDAGSRILWWTTPSGRLLAYQRAELHTTEVIRVNRRGEEYPKLQHSVKYEAKKLGWERRYLYGGLQAENLTQAEARDALWAGVVRCKEHGLDVVMHVHDEAFCEVPEGSVDKDYVARLLGQPIPALPDCPVTAKGWIGRRYAK